VSPGQPQPVVDQQPEPESRPSGVTPFDSDAT